MKTDRTTFVRGNERIDKLEARPDIAAGVAEVEAEAREMDRVSAEIVSHAPRRPRG